MFLVSLSSFSLALLIDAKLLDLVPISSSLKALDIVNFNSLLFPPILFALVSFKKVSPLILFVALCSASFLFSKSELIYCVGLERLGVFSTCDDLFLNLSLFTKGLALVDFPKNLLGFFSITTVFFD